MPHKSIVNSMKSINNKRVIKNELSYVNEFGVMYDIYILLETRVVLSDVIGRVNFIERELNRILDKLRTFTNDHKDQIIGYLDFQRKNALPLYRLIIKLFLEMSSQDLKIQQNNDRYIILKTLIEGLDIVLTEIEIIDPFPYLKEE